jgi:hypothetical protein
MLLVMALLLLGGGAASFAQSVTVLSAGAGSLRGKLTDLHSAPLGGVVVVVRNEATGTETSTTTARNGTFYFAELEAGTYSLDAESSQLGRGHLEGIEIAAGHDARVQAAVHFDLQPPGALLLATRDLAATPSTAAANLPAEAGQNFPAPGGTGQQSREVSASPGQQLMTASVVHARGGGTEDRGAMAGNAAGLGWVGPGWVEPGGVIGEAAMQVARAAGQLRLGVAMRAQAFAQRTDPVSPVVTTTMSAAEMETLPVSGRRWQDFVLDTPTATGQDGGASQTSLRGAGQEPADSTVDGASTRLAFGRTGGVGPESGEQGGSGRAELGQPRGGGRELDVAEAAIRTVQTEAGNAEAEGGRDAGGRMNVETRGGGNGLHGQGFLFDRQNIWGAQNPFTQWVQNTGSAASPVFTAVPYTPADHETVWGVGLGSQLRRDKLYWFAAVDSYRRNDPGLSMVRNAGEFFAQPTNDQLQVLSARLGLGSANPVAEGLTAYSSMLETLGGLLGPAPRTARQWVGFARIDWQAAERHRLTLEAIGATWNAPGSGLTRVSETYGNHSFGSSQATEEWLLGRWEAFLTPNLLAVTQGSAGHEVLSTRPDTPSAFEQTLLTGNAWGQLPQIVVDSRYGFTIGNPSRFGQGSYPDEHLYQGQETVDWARGSLLVKAGFAASHNGDATSLLRNQSGTYSYASVENFASDALVYGAYGLSGVLNPANPYGCDETGRVWRDSGGTLRGIGYLPCYSYYSQTMGTSNWHLSTNDWTAFVSTQWQSAKRFVLSAGLRWEREQLPPAIAALANAQLPLTEKLPSLGNDWGPRISLAVGGSEGGRIGLPVLRLGYGLYFGRTGNAMVETALTQTGSANGDQNFFIRPTDGYNSFTGKGDAPIFPLVLSGAPASEIKPNAVEFAPSFRNPEVHQAVAAVEESLPGQVRVTASALLSLGRRLPITIDTNLDTPAASQTITYAVVDAKGAGPIKTPEITVPFYASWPASTGVCPYYTPTSAAVPGRLCPDYQQISEIMSRANSTYEAAVVRVTREGRRGLILQAHYTYSHAMDWNPNESAMAAGNDILDPADFRQEYGTSNLDMRHAAAGLVIYEAPWKLHGLAGRAGNGWMISGIGQFHSGLPYTMRTAGSLAEEFNAGGSAIVGLGPGMNGSGGDNRVYGVGRNTYRYPAVWKADMRLGKSFNLGAMRKLELLAESFNLFNHQNVTEIETTGYYIDSGTSSGGLPTLNFLTGLKANTTAFGQPLNINATNFYRERQFQFGMQLSF